MFYVLHEDAHDERKSQRTTGWLPKQSAMVCKNTFHNVQAQPKFTSLMQTQRPTVIFSTGVLMFQTSKLETQFIHYAVVDLGVCKREAGT